MMKTRFLASILCALQLSRTCEAFQRASTCSTGSLFSLQRSCTTTPPFLLPATASSTSSRLSLSSSPTNEEAKRVQDLSESIEACIASREDPIPLISQLEKIASIPEPNRSSKFLGTWHVWYTDCPPPSNGKLGPFQGTAGQVIAGGSTKAYQNLLNVPPNDWLTAVLNGVWEDWDGVVLGDDKETTTKTVDTSQDWGATHWKVTFQTLRIAIFGFNLLNKEFPPETARVWRTTYLDDEIRVVRAGKTGRVEDEVVFYTKRTPPPAGWVPS